MKSVVIFLLVLLSYQIFAQSKYLVEFNDKELSEFNPWEYFDQKAIERKQKCDLPIFDLTDLPVNQHYIDSVKAYGVNVIQNSRWLNAIVINATKKQLVKLEACSFINNVSLINSKVETLKNITVNDLSKDKIALLKSQISLLQGDIFIRNKINGKGMRIAIFDGGFPNIVDNPIFKDIVDENRIIGTYDFVNKNEDVYKYMSHGTMVFTCIAGKIDDFNFGLATEAEFLLARTESFQEKISEEENWLAAVEWADKHGADIINSSLGYTYNRYFISQMDGNTSLVSKAAKLAASKGMLVLTAMGNDGFKRWKYLCTPADVQDVISVGSVDPSSGLHMSYSSVGPTADFRIKPNVSASGIVITSTKNSLKKLYGTSFATPLITGFAACVWGLNPVLNNIEIIDLIEKSATLYPYFDYAHGYGIPQAGYFIKPNKSTTPTFNYETKKDSVSIIVSHENISKKKPFYLYYHIENEMHYLEKYVILKVFTNKVFSLPLNRYFDGKILRVHYKGYTESYEF